MTNEEIKKAWIDKAPIHSNGTDYTKISALIYRLTENGEMYLTVELLDRCGNSVTIASPKNVELKRKD